MYKKPTVTVNSQCPQLYIFITSQETCKGEGREEKEGEGKER